MTVTKPKTERTDTIIVTGPFAQNATAEDGVTADQERSERAEIPSCVRGLPSALARLELGSQELMSEGQLVEVQIKRLSRNYTTDDDRAISYRLAAFTARTRQLRESDADLIAVMNSLTHSETLDGDASTPADMTNMRLNAMATGICLANAAAHADVLAQKLRAARPNGGTNGSQEGGEAKGGFLKKIAKVTRRVIASCADSAGAAA